MQKLDLNINKTKCGNPFRQGTVANPQISVKIKGTTLDFVNEYKNLDCMLTNNGNGDKHITQKYQGVRTRSTFILRNLSKCDVDTKVYLFRNFCTSFY